MSVSGNKTRLSSLLKYTPSGLFKWLLYKITGRELAVYGECLQCGRCCRRLNLSWGDHWIRRNKDFDKLRELYPSYDRFKLTERSEDGFLVFECDKITEDNKCGDRENRPDICRDYPDVDLFFTGGQLLEHCGYYFKVVPSFSRVLEKARNSKQTEETSD